MKKNSDELLVLCGAKSKRTGLPCRQPAMKNGRCRLHGGKSKGPRTKEGLARSRKGNWKHGLFSKEASQELADLKSEISKCKNFIRQI